jgi:hypothetical protein
LTQNRGHLPVSRPGVRPSGRGRRGGGLLLGSRLLPFDVGIAAAAFLNFIGLCSHISLHSLQTAFVYARNMKSWFRWFNIYLALAGVFLAPGCASDKSQLKAGKKELSTIRLYLEASRADVGIAGKVLVTRAKYPYYVEREPFLTEADAIKVRLVDDPGSEANRSYAIQLLFDDHATLLLDMITTANKGRHIVVFSQYPKPGYKPPKEKRKSHADEDDEDMAPEKPPQPSPVSSNGPPQSAWLAAVLIRERNANGIFRFTPDAPHEVGERIVRGLKNVIAATRKQNKF